MKRSRPRVGSLWNYIILGVQLFFWSSVNAKSKLLAIHVNRTIRTSGTLLFVTQLRILIAHLHIIISGPHNKVCSVFKAALFINTSSTHGRRKDFCRGGNSDFSRWCSKEFSKGPNNGEISFYQLKTNRKCFFLLKNQYKNVLFQNSGGQGPPCPPFRHPWFITYKI